MRESKGKAKMRRCRYCKGEFRPRSGSGGKEQRFCSAAHRKAFWKSGSLPYDKLVLRLEKAIAGRVQEQLASYASNLAVQQEQLAELKTRVATVEAAYLPALKAEQ